MWDVLNDDKLEDNWHIKHLCDELQVRAEKLIRRELKPNDLHINIPPSSSKSSIVSIFWNAWIWLHDPSIIIISSSCTASLALDLSIKTRDIILSDKFNIIFNGNNGWFERTHGKKLLLRKDKESKSNWANNFNGERITTSTGASIIGRHAHLIIRDDPMSVSMAQSEKLRTQANNFNNQSLNSRKKDARTTQTVTVMQRLHENDTTGVDLKNNADGIDLIVLPAELSDNVHPPELKDNYINGLLDSVRLNQDRIDQEKITLGSYGYAGQYQQRPIPEGGGVFKKEWFEVVDKEELPQEINCDAYIDGAYTESTKNDPTGFMPCYYDRSSNTLYITGWLHKYMEMPELLEFMPNFVREYNITRRNKVSIEPKASGKTMHQLLKKTKINAVEIKGKHISEGKLARAKASSPTCEAGKVKLVKGHWNENFLAELCSFPNAEHDESVDTLCYAIFDYFIKPISIW